MTPPSLSRAEREVLCHVRGHLAAHGVPPSVAGTATVCGLVPAVVPAVLRSLAAKGHLVVVPGRPGVLRVVGDAGLRAVPAGGAADAGGAG